MKLKAKKALAQYNVNVKLAGISIVINNFRVSGLASRLITDNAGWHTQNTQIFYPAILTYEKLYGILFFDKNRNYLKANLLKGRDAKPEGTKVRKLDHVSRLPLFPYYHNIWKRCLNRRDSDSFYTI